MQQPLPVSLSSFDVSVNQAEQVEDRGESSHGHAASSQEDVDDSDIVMRNESSLAPVDGGFQAWSFLFSAFLIEGIIWGFPDAFGVFLVSYLNDLWFALQKGSSTLQPFIGNLSSGIMYFARPVVYSVTMRYPYLRCFMILCGTLICLLSLLSASYALKLVILQGVLYAIGGSLVYHPCISYTSEWFIAHRGLANGVIFAGTAVGGLILPLILPCLLNCYSAQVTLRIISIMILCVVLSILPFMKGRLPESQIHGPTTRSMDYLWLRSWIFWLVMLVNMVQAFMYFVPILWLPISPWILASSTLICTSIATFILWGVLLHNLTGLLAYGVAYGTLASRWSSLWSGFIWPIACKLPQCSCSPMIGLGQVLSTPISTSLLHATTSPSTWPWYSKTGFDVAGGKFEQMIVYVGMCFAGAVAVAVCGWWVEKVSARGS
ncbi:hypothetical protein NEOLEDRAFT_1154602 [Neolentinus lepideus HHB14362 ss-1]|uniref:MFS general substrate transporter n=1 Tax=Neolentinus lepideus HHB14362 ss-1 TaxID=1314782 RepID=A0A165ULW5_9AGAM|nr:hypothetical protein NEOLEDRAFT_1154602 [Neolentinus lepideus HHB14362 ss-1]